MRAVILCICQKKKKMLITEYLYKQKNIVCFLKKILKQILRINKIFTVKGYTYTYIDRYMQKAESCVYTEKYYAFQLFLKSSKYYITTFNFLKSYLLETGDD